MIPPASSKIRLWTRLYQLPMFWNFVEYISLASCLSSLSLSHSYDLKTYGN